MKSLLKFLLLFSLIVIGKLIKEPTATDIAIKRSSVNELPVHMVSFFTRQASLQGTAPGDNIMWWQTAQPHTTNN